MPRLLFYMGGLEGPPNPPHARRRPGKAGTPLDSGYTTMGASKTPPQSPHARRRPGKAGTPLDSGYTTMGGLEGPPNPPPPRGVPARPGRPPLPPRALTAVRPPRRRPGLVDRPPARSPRRRAVLRLG